jgi:uncharacterized membrane protein YeaQ/YmgE (transglycosylase-associated protein family)
MTIVLWVLLGVLAGWIASLMLDGRGSLFANIVIGIIGAVTGGIVLTVFGAGNSSGLDSGSWLTAILGSVILLAIVKGAHRPAL